MVGVCRGVFFFGWADEWLSSFVGRSAVCFFPPHAALLQSAHHCFLPSSGRLFEQLRRGAVMATKSVCGMEWRDG